MSTLEKGETAKTAEAIQEQIAKKEKQKEQVHV